MKADTRINNTMDDNELEEAWVAAVIVSADDLI